MRLLSLILLLFTSGSLSAESVADYEEIFNEAHNLYFNRKVRSPDGIIFRKHWPLHIKKLNPLSVSVIPQMSAVMITLDAKSDISGILVGCNPSYLPSWGDMFLPNYSYGRIKSSSKNPAVSAQTHTFKIATK